MVCPIRPSHPAIKNLDATLEDTSSTTALHNPAALAAQLSGFVAFVAVVCGRLGQERRAVWNATLSRDTATRGENRGVSGTLYTESDHFASAKRDGILSNNEPTTPG